MMHGKMAKSNIKNPLCPLMTLSGPIRLQLEIPWSRRRWDKKRTLNEQITGFYESQP